MLIPTWELLRDAFRVAMNEKREDLLIASMAVPFQLFYFKHFSVLTTES